MEKRPSPFRNLRQPLRGLVSCVLLLLIAAIGLCGLAMLIIFFAESVRSFQRTTSLMDRALYAFMVAAMVALVGQLLDDMLTPLRRFTAFMPVSRVLTWPGRKFAAYGHYGLLVYSAAFVFGLGYVIPNGLIEAFGIFPQVANEAKIYVILVVEFLLAVHRGGRVMDRVTRMWPLRARDADYTVPLSWLHPSAMRFYMYLAAALGYGLANFEEFAGLIVISAAYWLTYKEVIVEVLLTFVGIDAVSFAWRGWRAEVTAHFPPSVGEAS